MVSTTCADRASRFIGFVIAMVLAGNAWSVEAKTNSKSLADNGNKPTPQTAIQIDRETESKAIELVKAHLPELDDVLDRLRADQPRQYDRAIRDLAKSVRKLELAKNRDEQLYELELELLKAQNQVNLLTAKLKVRDSQPDRKKLRDSATRLRQAQVARIQYDVELSRQRLARAKQQFDAAAERLEAKQSDPEQQLEKTFLGLLRKAGREPNK
jgi:hypothetical protein